MIERLPTDYVPEEYDLFLHVIPDKYPIDARVIITFKKNQESDIAILHIYPNIEIKSIEQNGESLEFIKDLEELKIKRSVNPQVDFSTHPVTINYSFQPEFDVKQGFYVYNGNYITQFEPNYCRRLLPCYDEPSVRSIFRVTLQIPTNLTGISNMPIEKVTEKSDNEKEIQFLPTPPMCTYLLCVVIGTFSCIHGSTINGLPVDFYGITGSEDEYLGFLEVSCFSLEWMEHHFKVRYELPRLQLVYYEGCPGGMENYGLITVCKRIQNDFPQASRVIMHEVIHMWFGDLVEIKWWNSIFLNEGFAQFIQYLIMYDYFPELKLQESFFFAFREGFRNLNYYYDERKLCPPSYEINYETCLESFVYVKGSFVLKMFYDIVGREAFFNCCAGYLNTFKNKNAEFLDFVSAVNSVMKKDLSPFFMPWFNYKSFPVLVVNEVMSQEDPSRKIGLSISQLSSNEVCYQMKIPILYQSKGKVEQIDIQLNDFCTNLDLEFDWVIVNHNFESLCFVLYSKPLLAALNHAFADNNLNIPDRNLITSSLFTAALPGLVDEECFIIARDFLNSC